MLSAEQYMTWVKGFNRRKLSKKNCQDHEKLQCHRAAAADSWYIETDWLKSIRFEKKIDLILL